MMMYLIKNLVLLSQISTDVDMIKRYAVCEITFTTERIIHPNYMYDKRTSLVGGPLGKKSENM